ncbi:MAG: hypothetical protein M3Z32_11210, partial [Acidobacteriota bacterium]|nr:hypothetical protein [Acidobacteriota bacterium]
GQTPTHIRIPMLHITNGYSVSRYSVSLDKAGLPGSALYWVDVLHEGPVPAGLSLDELSELRWQQPVCFRERDATLKSFREHEEVALWFEHDLYDQLLLIQLLHWFASQRLGKTRLSLICVDQYLGTLQPAELNRLFPQRHEVSASEFQTAQLAWEAFTSPEPSALLRLMQNGTAALPFLNRAILRHLEQFPGLRDGMSRTERQALQIARSGPHGFQNMFQADQDLEERIFMGDDTYRHHLSRLCGAKHPALAESREGYRLTDFGRSVLAGEEDHVAVNGIDRWLGGVHLHGTSPVWRWDAQRSTIAS